MRRHYLKCDPIYFEELWQDRKTCELRFNDRNFEAGDNLTIQETELSAEDMKRDNEPATYTGRAVHTVITHVLTQHPGLAPGYVILSFRRPAKSELVRVNTE